MLNKFQTHQRVLNNKTPHFKKWNIVSKLYTWVKLFYFLFNRVFKIWFQEEKQNAKRKLTIILNTLSKPIRDYLGCVPVKLVQTLFSNKSIPEQATRLVRPNFQQVLSWAIPRPRVQIIPQKALDPVRQVTRGEEVMGEIVNSKLGAYLEALHKLLFLYHSLLFLEIVDVSLTAVRIEGFCNEPFHHQSWNQNMPDWTQTCSYTDTIEPASVWTFFTAPHTGWDLREELSTGCR